MLRKPPIPLKTWRRGRDLQETVRASSSLSASSQKSTPSPSGFPAASHFWKATKRIASSLTGVLPQATGTDAPPAGDFVPGSDFPAVAGATGFGNLAFSVAT